MSKLFIIGNGFDSAHKLPTRYECFHKYLKETYPDADEATGCIPWSTTGHHGEESQNENDVVGYLMHLITQSAEEKWSDFEDSLGRLDFSWDLSDPSDYIDEDGDPNYFYLAQDNEDRTTQLVQCVPQIRRFFSEWVKTIDLSTARPKAGFQALINPAQDLFLNFNYTRTLEELYGISNVCHIHGVLGEELVVGHGAGPYSEKGRWSNIGSEDGIAFIHEALRKDTAGAMKKHLAFFEKLASGVSAVYSYGFSYGAADEDYIKEICHIAGTSSVVWNLLNYPVDNELKRHADHERFKKILRKCGFKGTFGTFDCL